MKMNDFRLDGKIALVTGASYGIGFAMASGLAEAGATIVFNDINQDLVNRGIAAYKEAGITAHGYVCDVTNEDQVNEMIAQIEKEVGVVDILVNNAGITKDMLLMRMKKEDFEDVIDVNLIGTFNVTKQVIPIMMKARSGRIINISSVVGISGNAGQTNYSASKAGIIGFTKSLAKEVASRNILVNSVAPGFIETSMTEVLKDEVKEEIAKNIPLNRMGTSQDVANVVKFLASDESSYITGQVIQVDGGMLM